MNAPLRPMLLALGALSLGGVLVLKSAHASEPSTFDTAVDSKAKDGGGWTTLGGKEGGSIELSNKGKDGGWKLRDAHLLRADTDDSGYYMLYQREDRKTDSLFLKLGPDDYTEVAPQ